MKTLTDYPQLPLLPLDKCFAIFTQAKIPTNMLGKLIGVTRMTIYKWRAGKAVPHLFSQERVSILAYKTLRAIRNRSAPFNSAASLDHINTCLDDPSLKSLFDYQPEDLLPPSWIPKQTTEV